MTDNEIMREKTFSEELPYFKERIKEIFDNFDYPDGYADVRYLSALSDSSRIVRKAEEEINRQQAEIDNLTYTLWGVMHSVDKWLDGVELEQDEVNRAATMREKTLQIVEEKQAEIERLKRENEILSVNSDTAFQDGLNEARDLYATEVENEIKAEAIREFAEKLKSLINQHHYILANIHNSRDFGMFTVGIEQAIDSVVKEMTIDIE